MSIMGVDYSLSSPALCVFHGKGDWTVDDCTFYYFAKKNQLVFDKNFQASLYPKDYNGDTERFDLLSDWAMDVVKGREVKRACIEGYAFGAVGRVFNIAENCGILKHKLMKAKVPFTTPAPSEIKKFASGKGNCNKEVMYESFQAETGWDLRKRMFCEKGWNPISDVVDAYYLAKFEYERMKKCS